MVWIWIIIAFTAGMISGWIGVALMSDVSRQYKKGWHYGYKEALLKIREKLKEENDV